jgi:dTDP-glucose 4,6-dehydratase
MKVLVTGAGGFIGSALVRRALLNTSHQIKAFARRTNDERLRKRLFDHPQVQSALGNGRLEVTYGDLLGDISGLCEGVDAVIHAGAKTFVDHSIKDPDAFLQSNTVGTLRLLEEARRNRVSRYIQVSTDEVYGSILTGAYDEKAAINPTNPYSAAKAAADAFVISYAHTYGMRTVVTRTENNYGPFQHPQKAVPVFVKAVMKNQRIPLYGDGMHVRQWLWVDDHVDALLLLLEKDYEMGGIYHVAGGQEISNFELVRLIVIHMKDLYGIDDHALREYITFVADKDIRPGHDRRYALKSDKIRALGWTPKVGLAAGLPLAIKWHKEHPGWVG